MMPVKSLEETETDRNRNCDEILLDRIKKENRVKILGYCYDK